MIIDNKDILLESKKILLDCLNDFRLLHAKVDNKKTLIDNNTIEYIRLIKHSINDSISIINLIITLNEYIEDYKEK